MTADFNPLLKNFGRAHGTGKWAVPTAPGYENKKSLA
jgi:hypothetical protein